MVIQEGPRVCEEVHVLLRRERMSLGRIVESMESILFSLNNLLHVTYYEVPNVQFLLHSFSFKLSELLIKLEVHHGGHCRCH